MNHLDVSNKHEEEILKFLKKLDFQDVNGGSNFIIGGHQIDACAGHEKTLLIIECTTQLKGLNQKMDSFRGKISNIIKGFREDDIYRKYKKHKLIIAMKHVVETDSNITYAKKEGSEPIYLWNNRFVKYYEELYRKIGKYSKFSLLSEIDIIPESSSNISIPVLSIDIGKGRSKKLFLFFIEAFELLKFSYVARRNIGSENYYQRMVNDSRLNVIKKYIEKGKIFPNSIIVSLKDGCWDFNSKLGDVFKQSEYDFIPKYLNMGILTLKNSYQSCWIIDGQHRLFSYTKTNVPGILAVSAFARLKEKDQADYFIDINREAKSVDPNLLWDLIGSLQPTSNRGIISRIVKELFNNEQSIFYRNIKIPSMGTGKFNFNNICVTIEKEKLIDKEWPYMNQMVKNQYYTSNYNYLINRISKEIDKHINMVIDNLNKIIRNEIITDGFISVLLKIFKVTAVHYNKDISHEKIKDISVIIAEYFNVMNDNELEKIRKMMSSEAGKTDIRNEIILWIREKYDKDYGKAFEIKTNNLAEKINDIEYLLNEYVNKVMTSYYGENWFNDPTNINDSKARKKCIINARKYNREPWEYLNFNSTIEVIIRNKKHWKAIFEQKFTGHDLFINEDIFIANTKLMWEYRCNVYGHRKSKPIRYTKDQEKIIEATYNILYIDSSLYVLL